MDTERYVKCGAAVNRVDGYAKRCNGKAEYWVLMDSELYMRCKHHWLRDFAGCGHTFTNLQDALAALAMEKL